MGTAAKGKDEKKRPAGRSQKKDAKKKKAVKFAQANQALVDDTDDDDDNDADESVDTDGSE